MEQIAINNYDDLLEFIKRDDITAKQGVEIVCKALTVVCFNEKSKDELINETEYYIKTHCQNNSSERPLFLEQLDFGFNISDVFKSDELKPYIDKLEKEY